MKRPFIAVLVAILAMAGFSACGSRTEVVVLVSANAEWQALTNALSICPRDRSPYGEWFARDVHYADGSFRTVIMHGGWGKTDAAGSVQYAIDRYRPRLIVNLGTCGGFSGMIGKGDVVVVTNALQYDIHERMGDSAEAITAYTVPLVFQRVVGQPREPRFLRARMVSADRDLDPAAVPELIRKYGAVAGDWETASLAHVARKNGVACVALRSVSDIVTEGGSEAYGDFAVFAAACRQQMGMLFGLLTNISVRN